MMTKDRAQGHRRDARRFFAVVLGRSGYALDYYPEERARYLRQERKNIIGDYATVEEANAAVETHLRRQFCAPCAMTG
jgi:hypothetical protein